VSGKNKYRHLDEREGLAMKKTGTPVKKVFSIDESIRSWTASPDGMRAIVEALSQAAATNDQLEAARLVDPQKLRTPLNL
jgi:hypothetical protein